MYNLIQVWTGLHVNKNIEKCLFNKLKIEIEELNNKNKNTCLK